MVRQLLRSVCALAALGAFGALGACATLDAIETNICGNHVVDVGEDCDGTPSDGDLACGDRDSANACRFVWDDGASCPVGYVESKDHRCRKPTGEFVETSTFPLAGERPQVALIDGDDVPDVGVAVGSGGGLRDRFVVHSVLGGADSVIADLPALGGAAFGTFSASSEAALAVGVPNALEFVADGDGSSAGVRGGLTLLKSEAGVLDLKVFTNTVVAEDVRFVVLPKWFRPTAVGPAAAWDLSLLGMITWDGVSPKLCVLDTGCIEKFPLDDLNIGPTVRTDFDDAGFLLSAGGNDAVFYVPRAGFQDTANFERLQFPLEGGAKLVGAASLADLNGDGLTDIVALGEAPDTGALGIYCLFGFPPDLAWSQGLLLRQVFDGLEDDPESFSHGIVESLQVVRLNRDAAADLLVGGRIFVSKRDSFATFDPVADFREQYREDGEQWDATRVATGDLNGDGLDDMVGQPFGSTLRFVFGGETLPLVRADANIKGELIHAAIADFNGDGAGDVLAALGPDELGMGVKPTDTGAQICNVEHELFVAFGRSGAFPTVPSSVGTVPQVLDIVSSRFVLGLDGFGDFGVVTTCQSPLGTKTNRVATVLGNAYDLVNSPFLLTRGPATEAGSAGLIPVAVFGADVINAFPEQTQDDLVIFGSTDLFSGAVEAYVWPVDGDAELDNGSAHALALPSWWAENYWIFPYDSALDVAGAPGVVATVTTAPALSEVDGSYAARGEVALHLVNNEDPEDLTVQELPAFTLPFPSNPNFWMRTYASIVTTRLNDDAIPDFLVVYGIRSSDDFAAATGGSKPPQAGADGAPDAVDPSLFGAMGGAITLESDGGSWVSREVAGFAPEDGHSPLDVVTVDDRIVILTTWGPYALSAEAGARSALAKENSLTSFLGVEAVAADFDDDGLTDMLVLDGASAALWSQIPENP